MSSSTTEQLKDYCTSFLSRLLPKDEVKLLTSWASPYGMRAVLALELKGIKYDRVEENLQNKSQLLLRSNPVHQKVPVLIHNGKSIAESAIIVQYIDEAWPKKAPFFPKDAYERAEQRFWGDFIDRKLVESLWKVVKANDGAAGAAANKEFIDNCKLLDWALAERLGPFFGGERMSYVDVLLAPYAVWMPAVSEAAGVRQATKTECPKLHAFFAAVLKSPIAKRALAEPVKLKQFVRDILPLLKA